MTKHHAYHLLPLLLACGIASQSARASLGGDLKSVQADARKAHAAVAVKAAESAAYTVHESTLPTGTVVRQYVSPAGTVFAVVWQGPYMPDLRQLLGESFNTMVSMQAHARHAGHPAVDIGTDKLVIQSHGHMHAFVGRAYLPQSLPAGVTADAIQ
ncbi:MAG: DUF2844 domain-containing protein [Burkholderiales bacterium]|nr:DUF2844 domain-containing protein [Burkholderiales bacterium]